MSCYESLSGEGILKKKDLQQLKKILITAYNKDVERINEELKEEYEEDGKKFLKKYELKKATARTNKFKLYRCADEYGDISLNLETGEFKMYIDHGNRSVEDVQESSETYSEFKDFLRKLPSNSKYGAKIYYENEYQEYDGNWTYYGGYTNSNLFSL